MQKEVDIKSMSIKPFELIGDEWMLIAAGDKSKHNMMTASWGGFGVLWNKPVATVYIRPSRFTINFIENSDSFSLNFFGTNKAPHKIGGSQSGRNIDKTKAANLTPIYAEDTIYYEEARLVLICKKLYASQLHQQLFLQPELKNFYKADDYHKVFIGEITKALRR